MTKESQLIEELTWEKARNKVIHIPELCSIIDQISPTKEYTLLKISYPFGSKILDNTIFNLPNRNGEIVPLTDTTIPASMRNQLTYRSIPLGIVIKNNVEVYQELGNKVFSLAYYGDGLDFGIWEYFGWTTVYNVSAGARSLYILPSISDSLSHKRLKNQYGVKHAPPTRFCDHWHVLTQIANSTNFKADWHCEIIFLTSKWIEKIENDPLWHNLKVYLLKKGWKHSGYARRKSILDLIWEVLAKNLNVSGRKFDPYIIDSLKHLTLIGTSTVSGSIPSIDTKAGPIEKFRDVYQDCYNLKDYIVTIMQPQYLDFNNADPVYYSFQYPTLLESVPRARKPVSVIENLRELKEVIDLFLTESFNPNLKFANYPINEIFRNLSFDFFHGEMYAYGADIRPSSELPKHDKRLLYPYSSSQPGKKFADNSSFVRGCVRISLETSKI